MNRRVMAVTAAAVMSMSSFVVPAMADEEEVVSIQITTPLMSMDPLIGGDATNTTVISNTMEGLFVVDADGQIQNGLCDSYEVSDDQKTYTFHIRDNAKWSDGTPVTAQDFAYAWKRNATAEGDYSTFTYQIEMAAIKNYEEVTSGEADADELGVTAVDDNTLKVELEYPVPFFLNLLTFSPWAPVKESKLTEEGDQFGVNKDSVLYCGAYTLDQWDVGGNTIVLKKNPDYWDAENVDVDEIDFVTISDTQQAVMAYQNGDVDNITLTGDMVSMYQGDPEFSNVPGSFNYYLMVNTTKDGYDNKDLRQAIAYAIDRESLCTNVLNDGSTPAYNMLMKGLVSNADGEDFADASGQYFQYDTEKAKELWAKAQEETDLREINIIYDEEKDFAANTAAFIQSQLESTLDGLTVNISSTPKKNRIQLAQDHDYDIELWGWGPDYADPTAILAMYESDHPSNYSLWSSDEFDKLYNEANTTLAGDETARWDNLIKCNDICTENAGCIPLFQTGSATLTKSNVTGITEHNTGVPCYYKFVEKD